MASGTYFYGLGRRKAASATARLYEGKGNITINGKSAAEFLSDNTTLMGKLTDPIALVGKQNDFDITLLAKGGGV
ncbi:MAG: 30S ribosomal protein S9, partial [Candidatus Saccharibacteria bacterium]|nr:30S ribosomal protein S9 [Candidatus Saccharibacteria bacterium]